MSKKDWTIVTGPCSIVDGLTASARMKGWKDVHTLAAVVGGLVLIGTAKGPRFFACTTPKLTPNR
jgi:hypothetical protein